MWPSRNGRVQTLYRHPEAQVSRVCCLLLLPLMSVWLTYGCAGSNEAPTFAEETPEVPQEEHFELAEVRGPLDSYSIQVPQGWTTEDQALPGGFLRRYYLERNGARVVQVVVRCSVDMDVETMMWQDNQIVTSLRGIYGSTETRSVSLAGVEASVVDYQVPIGVVTVEQRAVYLYREPCGWRVVLQAFGNGLRDQYAGLFQQILSTFRPNDFEVPFEHRDPYRPTPGP